MKGLYLDEVVNLLTNTPHHQLLSVALRMSTERPDLLCAPHVQQIIGDRLQGFFLHEIQRLETVSCDVLALMSHLPHLESTFVGLCTSKESTEKQKLIAMEILNNTKRVDRAELFLSLWQNTTGPVSIAAEKAYRKALDATNQGKTKIVPCAQSWSQMSPIEGEEHKRLCNRCGFFVAKVHSLEDAKKHIGVGCVLYASSSKMALEEIVSEAISIEFVPEIPNEVESVPPFPVPLSTKPVFEVAGVPVSHMDRIDSNRNIAITTDSRELRELNSSENRLRSPVALVLIGLMIVVLGLIFLVFCMVS